MNTKQLIKIVLILLFYVSPIIDNIYGYMYYQLGQAIPIAIMFRALIIILAILILKDDKIFHESMAIIILVSTITTMAWAVFYNSDLFGEINNLIRVLYIPLMVFLFMKIIRFMPVKTLYKYIADYGLIISLIVIVCFVLGIGNFSYGGGSQGSYGFGVKGFFKAHNDLGLTIILSLGVSCLYYLKYTYSKIDLFRCLVIASAGVLIGTRAAMILCLVAIAAFLIYLLFSSRNIIGWLRIPILIASVYAVFTFVGFIYSSLDDYALSRFEMDSLENARTSLTKEAVKHIDNFDALAIFIGEGSLPLFSDIAYTGRFAGKDEKEVEADMYEFIGGYGYVLGSVFIFFYLYVVYCSMISLGRKRDIESLVLVFLLSIFVVIGYLAGHAAKNTLIAPIYGILAALAMANKGLSYKVNSRSLAVISKVRRFQRNNWRR